MNLDILKKIDTIVDIITNDKSNLIGSFKRCMLCYYYPILDIKIHIGKTGVEKPLIIDTPKWLLDTKLIITGIDPEEIPPWHRCIYRLDNNINVYWNEFLIDELYNDKSYSSKFNICFVGEINDVISDFTYLKLTN